MARSMRTKFANCQSVWSDNRRGLSLRAKICQYFALPSVYTGMNAQPVSNWPLAEQDQSISETFELLSVTLWLAREHENELIFDF